MDFSSLLKNMPGIKDMISQMGDDMKDIKATGEAAAGMVKVTVNGSQEITKIEIDEELLKPEEKETLQKLIAGASNIAMKRIQERVQENVMNMAGKFTPPK